MELRSRCNRAAPHVNSSFRCLLAGLALLATFSVPSFAELSSSATETTQLQLSGNLTLTPDLVDFKNVVIGQKNTQTLQLTNRSNAPMQIQNVLVTGAGFGVVTPPLPINLAPGANERFTVAFSPGNTGAAAGVLEIQSNGSQETILSLAGSGETPKSQLSIQPSSVDFGKIDPADGGTETVTISNTGNQNVKINQVLSSGANFEVADAPSHLELLPQQQVALVVRFNPTAEGSASGTLQVLTADGTPAVSSSLRAESITTTVTRSSHSVNLKWLASSSSVLGYYVYRGKSSTGPYTRISASVISAQSFIDATVASATTYHYVVTAVDKNLRESIYSHDFSASIP